ncbi:APC family permease [Congregibacter litoralis]|uniref:Amino acid/polyamine/organocation transporter, APC superfamily n=1 Tax=Congregibacter litoralis KT71 TaxID=314285 RepID=A4ADZ7_9GAMM|nr:APC family permease [Congregibacter litoralis]EAQ95807.2 amino acid/polyamine/organocation transporter, APC superfamily [Congregibacter litoralis KT71]
MSSKSSSYEEGSLTLTGTVAMGTGVMIGAGIFALTGQVAEYAGAWFPLAFVVAAAISGFSAYSYIKVSNKYPSAGGIAMILQKAYGPVTVTGAAALLMAFSMIINESLVARTFGAYTLQLFDVDDNTVWVPVLAVALIVFAFVVNILGNKIIGNLSKVTAIVKVGGILLFALVALWAADFAFKPVTGSAGEQTTAGGFLAGVALAILAYKGFTTITNSGDEVENPEKNVGRAIIVSLVICVIVYLAVCFAVGSTLSIDEIIAAKDYALAEAARPAVGGYGLWFTVGIAMIATASGLLASVFAVSRMLAMLTDMDLIPHSHFGMPGGIQKHTLVYTVVMAGLLAAFFDLSRIASLGAIFYLVMDIIIHWGVFRHLRSDVARIRRSDHRIGLDIARSSLRLDKAVLIDNHCCGDCRHRGGLYL